MPVNGYFCIFITGVAFGRRKLVEVPASTNCDVHTDVTAVD